VEGGVRRLKDDGTRKTDVDMPKRKRMTE